MMNKYEANRQAKSIFMSYGDSAWNEFEDLQSIYGWTDEETDLVTHYYQRCSDRVQQWLGV